MKKVFCLLLMTSFLVVGCAKRPPQQMMYCVPMKQWNKLSPQKQAEVVAWFNKNAELLPENLEYAQALGDAQFGPPWTPPPKGISIKKCFRNMHYATHSEQYYPLPMK